MIELKSVTKIYDGNVTGVEDVSLKIEKGEFVFLVGESGSGKSTMLKLLMKEVNPTSGKLIINDQDVTKLSRGKTALLRRKMNCFSGLPPAAQENGL